MLNLPKALDFSIVPSLGSLKKLAVDYVKIAFKRLRWPETRLGAALRGAIVGFVFSVVFLKIQDWVHPESRYGSGEEFIGLLTVYSAIAAAILGKKGWASLVACLLVVASLSLGIAINARTSETAINSGLIAIVVAVVALLWGGIKALRTRLR